MKLQCAMPSALADEIDTQFNVLYSTFATLIVFSRYPSSASCVVTATGCSDSAVFPEILLGTCCSCCSVTLACASLTSRGSLFVVTLLLLSDPNELGCSALFPSVCRRLSVAADVTPVQQIRSELHQPAQCPCIWRTWTRIRCFNAAFSVQD